MAGAAKVCVVCGIDVANVKRVKDPQGNYYCQVCYDAKLADKRARTSGNVEVDFQCSTCQRFFAVEDVYDEGGTIVCKACFAARTRPVQKAPAASPPAAHEPAHHPPAAHQPAAHQTPPRKSGPPAAPRHQHDDDAIPMADEIPQPRAQVDELEVVEDAPSSTGNVWHVHDRGQSHGPMNEEELLNAAQEGRFSTAAHMWKEGMGEWVSVLKIESVLKKTI